MKKITALLTICLTLLITSPCKADTQIYTAKATAYCITGTTATGTNTTEGRTLASKREWFGATVYIWLDDGDGVIKPNNFIGCYVVEDTSKAGSPVATGKVLDLYVSNYEEAKQFGSKDVIFQVVKAEG